MGGDECGLLGSDVQGKQGGVWRESTKNGLTVGSQEKGKRGAVTPKEFQSRGTG